MDTVEDMMDHEEAHPQGDHTATTTTATVMIMIKAMMVMTVMAAKIDMAQTPATLPLKDTPHMTGKGTHPHHETVTVLIHQTGDMDHHRRDMTLIGHEATLSAPHQRDLPLPKLSAATHLRGVTVVLQRGTVEQKGHTPHQNAVEMEATRDILLQRIGTAVPAETAAILLQVSVGTCPQLIVRMVALPLQHPETVLTTLPTPVSGTDPTLPLVPLVLVETALRDMVQLTEGTEDLVQSVAMGHPLGTQPEEAAIGER